MMKRVIIKKMAYGGNTIAPPYRPDQYSEPETRFNKTLKSVPIDEANIEAEGGETALVPDVNGIPAHYNIEGPRHSQGGVPLNMPDNSFIFSDTAKMKIKDPDILKMFDYTDAQITKIKKSRGITPADIAKKYDINKYREALQDTHSNKIERGTAELNIKNANLKLAQLALYQESMKGFPDGIPSVALPFIGKFGIDPSSFLPVTEESVQQGNVSQETSAEEEFPQEMMEPTMAENGKSVNDLLNYLSNYQTEYTKQPDVLVDEKSTLKFKTVGQNDAAIMLAGLDIAGNVVRRGDGENEFKKRTRADYLYSDTLGDQGAYDVNTGEFKPSQRYRDPVQFTGAATYSKYGGGLRKFVYEEGGEFNPELGVYAVYKNGREVYMDANDVPAPAGWSPSDVNRIPEAKYGMQIAQDGAQKQSMYNRVQQTFSGNEKLKQLLYEKTLAALKNEQYLNKDALKRKGVNIDQAIAELTPEKALEAFLALQKRNYGVVENKGASWLRSQSQSNSKAYDDAYAEFNLGAAGPLDVALGQAAYLGYRDLLADRDAGLLEDDVNTDLKPYIVRQVGKQDESYGFDPEADISKIDAYGTNTTVGQLAGIVEPEVPVDALPEEPAAPEEVEDIPLGTIGETARPTPPVGPYPQDVLSMGEAFANRMDLKKYYPWAPEIEPVIPTPTFYDPRRAEANIMGSYNTALTQLGAFASPQQLSARASEVAGTAMSAVADTVGQIQNQNVQVANQFETQRASILNNANLTNAAQAKQLYDQTTLMNQQYDNAKRDARSKLLGTIKNTITNMATTDVINDVYGNRFMINPTKGGRLDFYNPPSTISPAQQSLNKAEQYAAIRKQLEGTNISDETLFKIVFGTSDTPINTQDTDAMAALGAMPRKYGGGVRKIKLKKAPK
jgi:hypothetical protein